MTETINLQGKMEGVYSFKAINSLTNQERDLSAYIAEDHFNLILNSGLNYLGTNYVGSYCCVGTGSTPVNASQTALVSQVAQTSTIQAQSAGNQSTPPYFTWGRLTFRFEQGVAAGNLTEVGIRSDAGPNSALFSRALIVDSGGNPTTLTILSDEYLDVTYELRFYPEMNDQTYELTLYGENYSVLVRPANVTSVTVIQAQYYFFQWINYYYTTQYYYYNGPIGTVTGEPSGSSYSNDTGHGAYVSNSYERNFICSLGLNDGNLSEGIRSILIKTHKADWQLQFTPPIPKDSFKTLVLNIYTSWSPYTP